LDRRFKTAGPAAITILLLRQQNITAKSPRCGATFISEAHADTEAKRAWCSMDLSGACESLAFEQRVDARANGSTACAASVREEAG
jgi:hypothetical protein